jgi:hypothetical protein
MTARPVRGPFWRQGAKQMGNADGTASRSVVVEAQLPVGTARRG